MEFVRPKRQGRDGKPGRGAVNAIVLLTELRPRHGASHQRGQRSLRHMTRYKCIILAIDVLECKT
jgi:hypothetical protein